MNLRTRCPGAKQYKEQAASALILGDQSFTPMSAFYGFLLYL
jgi:hypothetical protein